MAEEKKAKAGAKKAVTEKETVKAKHVPEGNTRTIPEGMKEKKEVKKGKKSIEEIEAELMGLSILKYPLITEKAVNMIEAENKLVFVVDRNATKTSIRRAVETVYKVKVNKVNIIRDMKARKKALVTIDKKFKADDIATKLGVI